MIVMSKTLNPPHNVWDAAHLWGGRMEESVSRLADMGVAPAAVTGLDVPVAAADTGGAGWVVAITPDGVVAAVLSADELADAAPSEPVGQAVRDFRAVVVAHPECGVVTAISSWAFSRAADWADRAAGRSVAIVVRDEAGIAGVWAGEDLDEVAEIGTTRSGADLTLPGDIHIPEYVRRCAFAVRGVRCKAYRSFAEPPSRPEPCDNPGRLPEHDFAE
jgi:hypothetical protein